MREDLASQTLNMFCNNNKLKQKTINVDKLIDWNDAGKTDNSITKDGMENMDDEVSTHCFFFKLKHSSVILLR